MLCLLLFSSFPRSRERMKLDQPNAHTAGGIFSSAGGRFESGFWTTAFEAFGLQIPLLHVWPDIQILSGRVDRAIQAKRLRKLATRTLTPPLCGMDGSNRHPVCLH